MHIEAGPDRIHYIDEGTPDLPTVVMVHGSCGGAGQWKRLADRLIEQFHVVRIDLPGMGNSTSMPIERVWTIDDDANAVGAVLDEVCSGPFHFVGHSAGCPFSWPALAVREPRVRSLTMFEPVFFGLIQDDPAFAFPKETAEGFVARADNGDLEGAMAFFVDQWAGVPGMWDSIPEKVRAEMRKGGPRLRHEWASGIIGEGFHPRDQNAWMGQLASAPLLLIQGGDTVPAAAKVCDRIAELRPSVTRLTVSGAGHMAPFTHAQHVADAVEAHLRAN